MKKVTLFIVAMIMTTVVVAQTSSDNSNNKPAPSEMGYIFDFQGNTADNCPSKIPYDQWFISPAYTVNSAGNDTLVVSTNGAQEGWHHLNLKLYDGNCSSTTVDMTNFPSLNMVVRSSVAAPQCMIILFDDAGNPADFNPPFIALTPGLNTMNIPTIDWRQNAAPHNPIDMSKIAVVGLYFRVSYDDNDGASGANPSVVGTFHVAHIKLGDQTGLTTAVDKTDISADLNAFPNPSTGTLNVSLYNASNSTVSLVDLTGNVVATTTLSGNSTSINTSGLPKGMYILKAENNSQIGYKKIIVQ
jgi:hypothetical protein